MDVTNIASSIVSDENNPREYVLNGAQVVDRRTAGDLRCALAIVGDDRRLARRRASKHKQQSMVLLDALAAPFESRMAALTDARRRAASHAEVTHGRAREQAGERAAGLGRAVRDRAGAPRAGAPAPLHAALGMRRRALREAAPPGGPSSRSGSPLAANGNVLQTLGVMRVTLDGARLATLEAARRLDEEGNKTAKGAIAACKVAAPKAALSSSTRSDPLPAHAVGARRPAPGAHVRGRHGRLVGGRAGEGMLEETIASGAEASRSCERR